MKRIVIAGGSGFLGQALVAFFSKSGDYEVVLLSRRPDSAGAACRVVAWDGVNVGDWAAELESAYAVINLAGRSVDCRYTRANRKVIMDSRVESTRAIGNAINRCKRPPRVWLNASTATIYKHTFGPGHDEGGRIGGTPEAKDRFSVEVAEAWETACLNIPTPFTRKVLLRTAMVLGHGSNSVFPVLRRLVRIGLGGKMGSGRQYVSWIHQDDFCRAIQWLVENEVSGPFNVAAPAPLPNAEMMRMLRQLFGARIGLPAANWMLEVGAFFLRTETELIIKSRRVLPTRLLSAGFKFQHDTFEGAAADLARQNRSAPAEQREVQKVLG